MSSSLLRDLHEDDAEQVASLFVSAFGRSRPLDPEAIRAWLRNPEFEPGWLRVLEEDGRVVGYGDIWPKADVLELDTAAPERWDVFFEWAEHEAAARAIPFVRTQIPHGHALAGVAAARGYEPWRHSLTMEIELAAPPAPAALPAGIDVRRYGDGDGDALLAALNEAFADDPFWQEVTPSSFRAFYLGARGFDPALWLLAWDGDELAGLSLAYPEREADAALGWIATLGVRLPWRRQGLGEALLRLSFSDLYARGLRRVGLGVDAQNVTGALRLYERVGMRAIRRSDNWRRQV